MTAAELARDLRGKRIRHGQYIARCPGHDDRNPSLSIRDGKRGIMLKCFSAGCSVEHICESIGISMSALFYDEGRKLSPVDLRKLEAERNAQRVRDESDRRNRSRAIDQARYWENEVQRLGTVLAEVPEDPKLARQFHWALDRSRRAQAEIRPYFHPCNVPGEIV